MRWRKQLQSAINQERVEIHAMKKKLQEFNCDSIDQPEYSASELVSPPESELQEALAENAYLHAVRTLLSEEIMKESQRIVEIRVQLGLTEILGK